MKAQKIWSKFYECHCMAEGVMLGCEFTDDIDKKYPLIDMAFFQHGFRGSLCFKERLRWCWHLLREGLPFLDMVVLTQETAKELGKDLTDFANTDFTKEGSS